MKLTKIATALLVPLLAISLAACSAPKDGAAKAKTADSEIAALMSEDPSTADAAAKLYQKLMQKENDILSTNSQLWEKVFLSANKNMTMIEDGKNYGDFLLDTIESAKDKFTAD